MSESIMACQCQHVLELTPRVHANSLAHFLAVRCYLPQVSIVLDVHYTVPTVISLALAVEQTLNQTPAGGLSENVCFEISMIVHELKGDVQCRFSGAVLE
jgi:hypothetical protein